MGNKVSEYIKENYPYDVDKILLADGFEEAFMGVVEVFGSVPKACYDYQKCQEILVTRDSMTWEEALEYLEFNVIQAYVGAYTPAFIIKRA